MLKVVCISDTHCNEPKLPDGDLLIHSGDWSFPGSQEETERFLKWIEDKAADYKAVVVVPGNHDRYVFANEAEVKKQFTDRGITFLVDESALVLGKWIYGMPWTPVFGRWAYMADEQARRLRCGNIPADTQILVTHGPPYGYMDHVPDWASGKIISVGCRPLLEAVQKIQPQLHTFGHIHEGSGIMLLDKTILCNASIMDENYKPNNGPKIIYLP